MTEKLTIQHVAVTRLGENNDNPLYLGTAVLQDPNDCVDELGTLRQIPGTAEHADPFHAANQALRDALQAADPGVLPAVLIDTKLVDDPKTEGFVAEAEFEIGDRRETSRGTHPTDALKAQLNAVVSLYRD